MSGGGAMGDMFKRFNANRNKTRTANKRNKARSPFKSLVKNYKTVKSGKLEIKPLSSTDIYEIQMQAQRHAKKQRKITILVLLFIIVLATIVSFLIFN